MDENVAIPTEVEAADYWWLIEDRTSGSFFWDRNTDAVRWSPKLLQVLGYNEPAARNLVQVEELIHPDDKAVHSATLSEAISSASSYTIEIRLKNAQGAYQPFRVYGCWLKKEAKPARFLIGFLTEVSEMARLRDQFTRIESLFQAFFDNAPAAVYIKDSKRKHLYGNALAARIAGCTVEEFVSSSTPDLFDEETNRALEEVDRRILEHGETVIRHGEFEAASGAKHYVYDTSFPLADPLTGETLIGGFGLDTTRQHEAEMALAQNQKMEALGQLVGGIAHDFNNTLAVLRGNLDLVEFADSEAEAQEYLAEVSKGVERGTRLTKQLLAYARKAVLSTEVLSLNVVIAELDRMLRRVLPTTIDIQTICGSGIWNTRIDRAQIESAILNLVLNARDAMPDGGHLTIETSNIVIDEKSDAVPSDDLQPGHYVLLAVTDTGTGMPEQVSQRAFDPFYTTKGVGKGTGMGLPMVEGLMRQIGGTARIFTQFGKGTTVKLYFPASSKEVADAETDMQNIQSGSEHILVVEDDDSVRSIVRRQLEKQGYRVSEAESGDSALEPVRNDRSINLLVTDVVMPGHLQGPDLARAAREMRPDLPVIFMSGYPLEASIHADSQGSDEISLSKPIRASDLARTVRSVLDDSATD